MVGEGGARGSSSGSGGGTSKTTIDLDAEAVAVALTWAEPQPTKTETIAPNVKRGAVNMARARTATPYQPVPIPAATTAHFAVLSLPCHGPPTSKTGTNPWAGRKEDENRPFVGATKPAPWGGGPIAVGFHPRLALSPAFTYAPAAMRLVAFLTFALIALLAGFGAGCAPVIGDDCGDSVDCSVNGDRICDIAQPAGYCTIQSCEPDTCPDDAVCVRFRPEPSRLAQAWCMKVCEKTDDCRKDDGYLCVLDTELGDFEVEPGIELPIATTIDVERPGRRFCAAAADL